MSGFLLYRALLLGRVRRPSFDSDRDCSSGVGRCASFRPTGSRSPAPAVPSRHDDPVGSGRRVRQLHRQAAALDLHAHADLLAALVLRRHVAELHARGRDLFYVMLPAYALLMRRLGRGTRPRFPAPARVVGRGRAVPVQHRVGARSCSTASAAVDRAALACRATSTSSGSEWRWPRLHVWCGADRPARRRCSSGSVATPTCASRSRSGAS